MSKPTKAEVIRARTDSGLKSDVRWAASVEGLEEADVVRRACRDYVSRLKSRYTSPQPLLLDAATPAR